jgi:hypothetical protein
MSLRISINAAIACLLASCYPYPEPPRTGSPQNQQQQPSITTAEQQRIQEQRDRMRQQAEREQAERQQAATNTPREQPAPPPTQEPTRRGDYPFAVPIPGKKDLVFSPYTNKEVDVRGIPSGTLVNDPTFPQSEGKFFRVP